MRICFVILEHQPGVYTRDLVSGIRRACPGSDLVWYDSGDGAHREIADDIPRLACSRPLKWGKMTPFFLDLLSWAATTEYDYFVYAESDMLFCRNDLEGFLSHTMLGFDYMAPYFRRGTPSDYIWNPFIGLANELPELLNLLGMAYTNRCFTPGQVFSARFAERVTSSAIYGDLRGFVERNQSEHASRSLQEVLIPTLVDRYDLSAREFPPDLQRFNRWRPYWTLEEMVGGLSGNGAPFLHPVRREEGDPVRQLWRHWSGHSYA